MKNLKKTLLFTLCLLPALAGFSSGFEEEIGNTSIEKIIKSKLPPEPSLKKWTIAVYMNGKSNIEPFAMNDFNRFETVGSGKDVNIVVEIGRSKGLENDTTADGDWAGVRRYYIVKDSDTSKINSPMLQDLGNPDMGDWKQAADFLKWAKENYPARKYMFIIWDHGWGWIDPKKPGENLLEGSPSFSGKAAHGNTKSISHDFVSGNYIKTTELSNIFKEAGGVDLYASMACFMQMAEVAYEIKDYANVIVGSEEVIQLPSFNFEDFFSLMLANPGAGAETAGIFMTDTFKEMYSRPEYQELLNSGKYGTQLSAIRGKELKKFAAVIRDLAAFLPGYQDKKALLAAKKDVLRFEVGDETTDPEKLISFYADIYDFMDKIDRNADKTNPSYPSFKSLFERLKKSVNSGLVVKNVFLNKDRTGKDYSATHGISMHIPGEPGNLIEYHHTYSELAFEKETGWSRAVNFLENLK